jgi:hypothetical protein
LWEAYEQIEPFGEMRDDVRAAQVASMVHNMAMDVKNRKPLNDFLIDWAKLDEEAEKRAEEEAQRKETGRLRQTPEEQLAIAYMWARALSRTLEVGE